MTWQIESFTDVGGNKDQEFINFIDLPARTTQRFELAINGPQNLLRSTAETRGRDEGLANAWDYRTSSTAKPSSAWPSTPTWSADPVVQRSHGVLPGGRPSRPRAGHRLDRAFADGHGLLRFSNCEEALDGLDRIAGDWTMHSKRAAEIAREHFDAGRGAAAIPRVACSRPARCRSRRLVQWERGVRRCRLRLRRRFAPVAVNGESWLREGHRVSCRLYKNSPHLSGTTRRLPTKASKHARAELYAVHSTATSARARRQDLMSFLFG